MTGGKSTSLRPKRGSDPHEPSRAYPIRILNYHEVVNDEVDGDPIAVTWCPICGSAVVYDAIANGRRLTFGASGKLADDDLVPYDRETDSEWKRSIGECVAGEFAGERLRVRPGPMTTREAFREAHPDGVIEATIGGTDVAVLATDDWLHAFERPGFELRRGRIGRRRRGDVDDDDRGERRRSAAAARSDPSTLFAWQDDHDPDPFYRE